VVERDLSDVQAYYERDEERERLSAGIGLIEFERTKEILGRALPSPPAVVADIGGGAGRYAFWLADLGYEVHLRDLVALHVDHARRDAGEAGVRIDAAVADARSLDFADASVDAVLLLGPLYHLTERGDRLAVLREARRIVRPGGAVMAAAISRWIPRLDGLVRHRVYERFPETLDLVDEVERSGEMPALEPGGFGGYCHRPDELREEAEAAGLEVEDLVSVEGIAFALADLDERLASPEATKILLDAARAIERVPELLGLGPHLIVTARRPDGR
jgi:SAM-dependent methyltransferase